MSRRDRVEDDPVLNEQAEQRNRVATENMFDLAAPAVEDDLVGRLIPKALSPQQQQLFDDMGITAAQTIELRASSADTDATTTRVVVGRSIDLRFPFRIDCPRLSSQHATFTISFSGHGRRSAVSVTDTSTNGVWVNGRRIAKGGDGHRLVDGDTVCLLKPESTTSVCFPFAFEHTAVTSEDAEEETGGATTTSTAAAAAALFDDRKKQELLSEVTCSICAGTYHKPTCLLPCLHTFCQPCARRFIAEKLMTNEKARRRGDRVLGGEADRGGAGGGAIVSCPECRAAVTGHSLNHKVQSLIQQVAASDPALARDQDEIVQLEQDATEAEEAAKKVGVQSFDLNKNASSNNSGLARALQGMFDDDDDGGGEADVGFGDLEEAFLGMAAGLRLAAAEAFRPNTVGFAANPASAAGCPQCKQPDPIDGFRCPPGGSHLKCKFCDTKFPDRPALYSLVSASHAADNRSNHADKGDHKNQDQEEGAPSSSSASSSRGPQRCKFCATAYCDAYCGPCKNPAGRGVLKNLEEYDVVGSGENGSLPVGADLFKGNTTEQQILAQYLQDSKITPKMAWRTCRDKFLGGEWALDMTAGMAGTVTGKTPMCSFCMERVFGALLIKYRIAVPRSQWPPAVGARPDCWYGLECRTQHHKQDHAARYNHVCVPRKGKE